MTRTVTAEPAPRRFDAAQAQKRRVELATPGSEYRVEGELRTVVETAVAEATGEPLVLYSVRRGGRDHFILCRLYMLRGPAVQPPVVPDWHERGQPERGSRWRHFRTGAVYRVVCGAAVGRADGRHYVVYRGEDTGDVWARPAADWHADVEHGGQRVRRFTELPVSQEARP